MSTLNCIEFSLPLLVREMDSQQVKTKQNKIYSGMNITFFPFTTIAVLPWYCYICCLGTKAFLSGLLFLFTTFYCLCLPLYLHSLGIWYFPVAIFYFATFRNIHV